MICQQLLMIGFVPRSRETPSRVSPEMTVNPMWRGETLDELLLLARPAHALIGGSAVVSIWFNWCTWSAMAAQLWS